MALSHDTQQMVADVISTYALMLRESEIQREVLAKQDKFVLLNAFCRMDRKNRQKIDTIDLMEFFCDNNLIVSEADCYMLVR
jgi:uncharacterized protein YdaU (DUF1376 family)